MNISALSKKYNIPVEIINKEFLPIAQEESSAMGKEGDNAYINNIIEELCKDYLKENFTPNYKSIFDTNGRYKPIFGDVESYSPIDFDKEDELDEETMSIDGVQSTDFSQDVIPEYPVDGSTKSEVEKRKKEFNTLIK